jgi:hypothetical protein
VFETRRHQKPRADGPNAGRTCARGVGWRNGRTSKIWNSGNASLFRWLWLGELEGRDSGSGSLQAGIEGPIWIALVASRPHAHASDRFATSLCPGLAV